MYMICYCYFSLQKCMTGIWTLNGFELCRFSLEYIETPAATRGSQNLVWIKLCFYKSNLWIVYCVYKCILDRTTYILCLTLKHEKELNNISFCLSFLYFEKIFIFILYLFFTQWGVFLYVICQYNVKYVISLLNAF